MRSPCLLPIAALAGLLLLPSAPVSAQDFSVIVHRSNPVTSLTLSNLRDILFGNVTHWPNQSRIVLAERGSGSPVNRFLMGRILKTSWIDYKRSLEAIEFSGQDPVIVRVLNSDPAACKFVFNVPSALAVVETSSTAAAECRDLRVLKIDGLLPGQEGYHLK